MTYVDAVLVALDRKSMRFCRRHPWRARFLYVVLVVVAFGLCTIPTRHASQAKEHRISRPVV